MSVAFIFVTPVQVFGEIVDTGFENRHTYRVDTRSDDDDHSFYITRAAGYLDFKCPLLERTFRIAPFFEYQSNFDTNTWWRKELGAEIGTSFFNDILYYGASLQYVWQKLDNYPVEDTTETAEWESRFVITPPINWWIFGDTLFLRLFNEYTIDLERGQGTFNEVGVVFDWQVLDWLRLPMGYRHVDRVHDYDADTLEFSVVFSF